MPMSKHAAHEIGSEGHRRNVPYLCCPAAGDMPFCNQWIVESGPCSNIHERNGNACSSMPSCLKANPPRRDETGLARDLDLLDHQLLAHVEAADEASDADG
jgi:hypothetical protein